MAIKISTSTKNQVIIKRLTNLYNFSNETIIVRIALTYSLQTDKKFSISDYGVEDSGGKILREDTLFGRFNNRPNYSLYKAMLEGHYEKSITENEFYKLLKLHIDDGLSNIGKLILDKNKSSNFYIDFLLNLIKKGSNLISGSSLAPISKYPKRKALSYKGLVNFSLGISEENNNINIRLNDLKEFDSHHMAVAGMTGSGKSELVKDILYQINKNTENRLKFIFFDYKGEGKSDKIKTFIEATDCEFMDVLQDGIDLNPLSYIDLEDERLRNFNINSFIDAIGAIERKMGAKQKHILKTVVNECFDSQEQDHPTIENIFEALQDYYEETNTKIDTLYAIMEDLSKGLFINNPHNPEEIYKRNIYVSLPKTLSDTLRQLCVFLTLNYLLAVFNSCDDTVPDSDRINPLRYIIVIDEAHVYLNNKNARKMLETLLRVIRSKGVVVIMLSQGAEDYKKSDFDFASQVKLPICLNINNKDYKLIKSFVGTPRSEIKLKDAISKLDNGKAVINIKEPKVINIRQFWRTMKEFKN
jgi:DNA sulfur modification protein DndE